MKEKLLKLLVLASTELEMRPLLNLFEAVEQTSENEFRLCGNAETQGAFGVRVYDFEIDFLITGVGMTASAFALGRHLANHTYDGAIQFGLAGSFSDRLPVGSVVLSLSDQVADEGVFRDGKWMDSAALGLGAVEGPSVRMECDTVRERVLFFEGDPFVAMPRVGALSVNTITSDREQMSLLHTRTGALLETMEGAAFFYAALQMHWEKFYALRGVSNYVAAPRSEWNIPLALKHVCAETYQLMECFLKK